MSRELRYQLQPIKDLPSPSLCRKKRDGSRQMK